MPTWDGRQGELAAVNDSECTDMSHQSVVVTSVICGRLPAQRGPVRSNSSASSPPSCCRRTLGLVYYPGVPSSNTQGWPTATINGCGLSSLRPTVVACLSFFSVISAFTRLSSTIVARRHCRVWILIVLGKGQHWLGLRPDRNLLQLCRCGNWLMHFGKRIQKAARRPRHRRQPIRP